MSVCHGAGFVSLLFRSGCVASSSQRSLCSSIGCQKGAGSAVWISTGIFNSLHFSQIASSLASSTVTRFPLTSFTERPRFLNIFKPFAPLCTSASSCFTAFSVHPEAPTLSKSILANTIKRLGYCCFIFSVISFNSLPLPPLRFTITRILRLSISFTRPSRLPLPMLH